jgi:hypothetical protein
MASPNPDAPPSSFKSITLPPGHHRIAVKADGYDPAAQEFDLSFADVKNVRLALALAPPPPPVAPPPVVAVAPPPPPPPPPPPRSKVPAYVTLGLAGVGVVAGTAFGILALQSKSNFNAAGGMTVSNADATDRNALISDMSFAVAITFGVTGTVLLLSNDTSEAPKTAAAGGYAPPPKSTPVRAFVSPYGGPNGGSF